MGMQFVDRTPPEGGANQTMLSVSDASIRLTPILILDDSAMMFSVWCQAASGTTIQIIGGNTQAEMVVSTGWKRAVVQMEDVQDVVIMVPAGATVYFYKAQLEAGTKASDWKPAPEDTEEQIDGIQVGGRNLLPKELYNEVQEIGAHSLSGYGFSREGISYEVPVFGQIGELSLSPNVDYIVSFTAWIDATDSSAMQALEVDLYPDTLPQCHYTWNDGITSTPTRYQWSFNSPLSDMESCSLRFFNDQATTYNGRQCYQRYTIYITDIQLEKGTRATDWTPAPEDVSECIAYAQSTANDAKTTAEQTRTDFQRVVRIDDAGLHVGDNQSNSEVCIDSDSVNVVTGGLMESKFAGSYIQFGYYQLRRTADNGLAFKVREI